MKNLCSLLYYHLPRFCPAGSVFSCRNFVFELTYRCNLNCRMCYIVNEIQHKAPKESRLELEDREIIRITEQLPGSSNVTFTGGEVFLKRGIDKIIQHAAARHRVTLATNGVLLSGHAAFLIQAGVQAIGVSVDGPPALHDLIRNRPGAFEQLAEGVEAILRRRRNGTPRINVNTVILEDNYLRLPEIPRVLKEIGIDACSFQIQDLSLHRSGIAPTQALRFKTDPLAAMKPLDPIAIRESLEKLLREGIKQHVAIRFEPALTVDEIVAYYQAKFDLNGWTCRLPWETMRISPYGDVYPCLNLMIGNVREHKPSKLWNCATYRQFRRTLKSASLFPACTGCCKMQRKRRG